MPTTAQRISAILISAVLLAGGAFAASLVPSAEAEQKTGTTKDLEITFEGVRNSDGHVIVFVFDDADAYNTSDYGAAVGYREVPASTGTLSVSFSRLTSGPYAAVAFHDENGNRDLDMNGTIPREGYAVTGAKDAFDEPAFERAASDERSRRLRVHYLN